MGSNNKNVRVRLAPMARSRFGGTTISGQSQSCGFDEGNLLTVGGGHANLPGRAIKHSIFIRCRGVPRATKGLCKGRRSGEHVLHGGYLGHVPLRDVTIKRWRGVERGPHVGHPGYVPLGDVAIKKRRKTEHGCHVSHAGHVPLRDVTVEFMLS